MKRGKNISSFLILNVVQKLSCLHGAKAVFADEKNIDEKRVHLPARIPRGPSSDSHFSHKAGSEKPG